MGCILKNYSRQNPLAARTSNASILMKRRKIYLYYNIRPPGARGARSPGRPFSCLRLHSERAPDNLLHDLVGASVDTLHPRVQVGARNRILQHVAIATVKLNALIDDALLEIGGPPLGHGGYLRRERALKQLLDAAIDEDPSDLDLGLHLGQLEARVLKTADRLAEGGALLAIVQRHLQSRLASCHCSHSNVETFPSKLAHQVVETLSLLAK